MNKTVIIGVLCMSYSLVNKMPVVMAQSDTVKVHSDALELEEVSVIGQRSQFSSSISSRIVTVVAKDEIEKAGIQNIVDFLEFLPGIDIRQRGGFGVQSDASIRGSSFDHVMILINGVNMSDPQTGHLSLDIPIDHEIIERVEILEGSGSRYLGTGAFSGAINIVTQSADNPLIYASQTFGDHSFLRSHFHATAKTGILQNYLSLSRTSSEGYSYNTDFTLYNIFYRGQMKTKAAGLDVQAGYQDKDFGAGGYYSPRFPDQYEETGTWFASFKASMGDRLKIIPQVYWRRKNDHFLLDKNNPSFYENYHVTDVYGSQFNLTCRSIHSISTLGLDIRSENILSNNIGLENPRPSKIPGTDSSYYSKQYNRTNFAIFIEHHHEIGRFYVTAGTMINMNSGLYRKPFLAPGIDISYRSGEITWFASINRSLHLPTFTDLFYTDPQNEGNLNLKPNRQLSLEGGIKFISDRQRLKLAAFYNSGKQVIDWLWSYTGNRFAPVNLEQLKALGYTASADLIFPHCWYMSTVSVGYEFLSVHKSVPDSVSKYSNLRHKFIVRLSQHISNKVCLSWNLSYQDRYGNAFAYNNETKTYYGIDFKPVFLLDASLKWTLRYISLFAEVSNILNTRYIDAGSVHQPGRWFRAGLAFTIDK